VRRLTFSYAGGQIDLVSDQLVTMIIPESHSLGDLERAAGFAYILKDDQGLPLYGRSIPNPIPFDREVFDRDPKRSIRREANPQPKGSFVLLVPAIEHARRIEFFGHPLKPEAFNESPRRLASFTLGKLPRP
jgi:hypothetical protein